MKFLYLFCFYSSHPEEEGGKGREMGMVTLLYMLILMLEESLTSLLILGLVVVIPICSVMNPIAAKAEEPYESVLEAVAYLMPLMQMFLPIPGLMLMS